MRLFLMRHGKAEPGGPGLDDFDRRLTPKGIKGVKRQAKRFEGEGPQVIITSPYVRARTTAEQVAEHLGLPVEVATELGCGATLEDYAQALFSHHPVDAALLVGHQPDLGNAVLLLSGRRAEMRPGTVAVLSLDAVRPRGGTLDDVWQPD